MKSYQERLPLIDEAIEYLKEFPKQKGLQAPDRCGVFYVGVLCGTLNRSKGSFQGADFVCTREEFEQRKAELEVKEQDMNDWYKNGELPPVGIVVEVLGGAYGSDDMVWRKSEIYAHVKGEVLAESTSHSGVYKLYSANECRPPRTETDKLLEQMERSFESTGCVFTSDHYALAEHLIEQGYRKIKQMTEDEFVLDLSNRFETYSEMYQAGCRFIEQGE